MLEIKKSKSKTRRKQKHRRKTRKFNLINYLIKILNKIVRLLCSK